jgi:DNA-binding transcriptional LysR family regulator
MPRFNIRTFDLNLLVVFLALWETRSVTRASEKLALTQPAVSHALRRLRDALGDDLFVQSKRGLLPTARAEQLAEPVRAALEDIGASLLDGEPFAPATARREFAIAASELVELSIAPALFGAIHQEAPGVLLRLGPLPDERSAYAMLEAGDLHIVAGSRDIRGAGMRNDALAEVHMTVLAGRQLGLKKRKLPLETYLGVPHVVIRPRDHRGSKIDQALAQRGLKRPIGAVVQNYVVMAMVAARCGYICHMPSMLAQQFAEPLGLSMHDLPVKLSSTPLMMSWHKRHESDPGFAWLLARVRRALSR